MNPIERAFLYLKLLFSGLPLLSWRRLLMPFAFMTSWSVMRGFSVEPPHAFVFSGVLAQLVHYWVALPATVAVQRQTLGQARQATSWAAVMVFVVMALQVWWLDPVMSQRVISLCCVLYIAVMCLGVSGDPLVRARYVPVREDSDVPEVLRTHLLKLYALVAFLLLAVNEALIVAQTPLHVRVITLSLVPIALHYLFHILLRMTCPRLDEGDA